MWAAWWAMWSLCGPPSSALSPGRCLDIQLLGNQVGEKLISSPSFISLFKMCKMARLKERQKRFPCIPTPASRVSPRGCSEPSFLCLLSDVPLLTAVTFAGGSGRSPRISLGCLSGFSLGDM